jgi:hypothetical protein
MSSISSELSSLYFSAQNTVCDLRNPSEQNHQVREGLITILDMAKVALVITTIATFFIFSFIPNIFLLILAGTLAFTTTEIHKITNNTIEMFDHPITKTKAFASREKCIAQIAKNTLITGPILRLLSHKIFNHPSSQIGS